MARMLFTSPVDAAAAACMCSDTGRLYEDHRWFPLAHGERMPERGIDAMSGFTERTTSEGVR